MKRRFDNYIYFIFWIIIVVFTLNTYYDIRNKELFIKNNKPVSVRIISISKYAKSSSTCDIEYNNKLYKDIPYPGGLKIGEYSDIFYYNKEKDIIFSNKIEYNIVYVLCGLSIFFFFLWIRNIRNS